MQRHRDIAAAPRRPASATWQAITDLMADTLDRSPNITRREVENVLLTARIAGLPLVAGGHLDTHSITLIAGQVNCTIGTVSGTGALSLDENLGPIPGGARPPDSRSTCHPGPARRPGSRNRGALSPPFRRAASPRWPPPASDQRPLVDFEALARRQAYHP